MLRAPALVPLLLVTQLLLHVLAVLRISLRPRDPHQDKYKHKHQELRSQRQCIIIQCFSEALRRIAEKCQEREFQFEDEDILSRGEIGQRESKLKC